MTDSMDVRDLTAECKVIDGPFAFDLSETSNKIRIGISLSPMVVIWMDKTVQNRWLPNRSAFIELACIHFIHYLRETMDFDKLIEEEVNAQTFYMRMWEKKEEGDSEVTGGE